MEDYSIANTTKEQRIALIRQWIPDEDGLGDSGDIPQGAVTLEGEVMDGVKVLGNGELTKALTVKAAAYSASAKEKIEKAGGKAEVM